MFIVSTETRCRQIVLYTQSNISIISIERKVMWLMVLYHSGEIVYTLNRFDWKIGFWFSRWYRMKTILSPGATMDCLAYIIKQSLPKRRPDSTLLSPVNYFSFSVPSLALAKLTFFVEKKFILLSPWTYPTTFCTVGN